MKFRFPYPLPCSILMAVLLACCYARAAVAARWHSLTALMAMVAICAVAGSVVVVSIARVSWPERRRTYILSLASFAILFGGGVLFANRWARSVRTAEISAALASGLLEDCESVLAPYDDDPRLDKEGVIRLLRGSEEFESLPESVRGFDPVYVTIEKDSLGRGVPLNLGLCKNGFGGFHMGVRVFRDDPKIPTSRNRERIAPTVYLWIGET